MGNARSRLRATVEDHERRFSKIDEEIFQMQLNRIELETEVQSVIQYCMTLSTSISSSVPLDSISEISSPILMGLVSYFGGKLVSILCI